MRYPLQPAVRTMEGAKVFLEQYLNARVRHESEWQGLFEKNLQNYFTDEYLASIQEDWNLESQMETITDSWEEDGYCIFETTGYGLGQKRYVLFYNGGWRIDRILTVCETCEGEGFFAAGDEDEEDDEEEECEECQGTGWIDWID